MSWETLFSRYSLLISTFTALVLASGQSMPVADRPDSYSIEDRTACQIALEDLRWSYVTWPKENAEPKPDRSSQLSDEQIRAKVEDSLRMESALKEHYGLEITAPMLQAELDRMAASTRDPKRLQELFDALDNDARHIAECVARPNLVRSKLQSHFAWDQRIHGDKRRHAENGLKLADQKEAMKSSGGEVQNLHFRRKTGSVDTGHLQPKSLEHQAIEVEEEDFQQLRQRLEHRAAQLRETEGAFVHETLVSQADGELQVKTLVWAKQSFEDWWKTESSNQPISQPQAQDRLCLPMIAPGVAFSTQELKLGTFDRWSHSNLGVPSSLSNRSAIWTGTEMIVWGGHDGNVGGRYNPVTDTWVAVSLANAPSTRWYHTSVWTGTEMIIWGGTEQNTGGRYNPVKDTWLSTSITNAPSARSNHSAVWTGSEMLVWGGFGYDSEKHGSAKFATGARYNPATDTWLPIGITNAPSARYYHTAVWTGSKMLVWGGYGDDSLGYGIKLNTGARYDPVTDTWVSISTLNAPNARYGHTAVWTGSKMLVWGGYDPSSHAVNTGGRYNPEADTWLATSTDDVPSARVGHSSVWTGTELIIWGGSGDGYQVTGGRYNPVTDTWLATGMTNAPSARSGHAGVWIGSEMLIWGGYDGSYLNTGGRYNPGSDTWTSISTAEVPQSRQEHSAIWTGSEMIVWGGYSFYEIYGDRHYQNTGVRYNPATDTWLTISLTNAPSARGRHSTVWTGTEMIVWGGYDGDSLSTGSSYNPSTDTWVPTGTTNAPSPRSGWAVVWTGSEMLVWGGYDGSFLNTGGRYNPVTNTWEFTSMTKAPSARSQHSAVWTGSEMLVWGGYGDGYLDTGGRYNPGTDSWTAISTTDAPAVRSGHAAVWTGSEMLLWGGDYQSTGGRYNPLTDTWAAISTTNAPEVIYGFTTVWTGSEMLIWGGALPSDWPEPPESVYQNTGARYSAATDTWTPTSLAEAPNPRAGHTAVWTGTEMLVWGGNTRDSIVWTYEPYVTVGMIKHVCY